MFIGIKVLRTHSYWYLLWYKSFFFFKGLHFILCSKESGCTYRSLKKKKKLCSITDKIKEQPWILLCHRNPKTLRKNSLSSFNHPSSKKMSVIHFITIWDGSETIKKTSKLHQYNKDLITLLLCLFHHSNKQANGDWLERNLANLYCKRIFTHVTGSAS